MFLTSFGFGFRLDTPLHESDGCDFPDRWIHLPSIYLLLRWFRKEGVITGGQVFSCAISGFRFVSAHVGNSFKVLLSLSDALLLGIEVR